MADKPLFVISDLHIGDGSTRDNLEVRGRAALLKHFLDYVDHEQGELIIVGDLFEFWRYRLDKVVEKRIDILDSLEDMGAVYIAGNHDYLVNSFIGQAHTPHPFFERTSRAFMRTIGSKRFKFMHGHEVDPFIPSKPTNLGRLVGSFWGMIEPGSEACVLHRDAVSDLMFELGEAFLHVWYSLSSGMNRKMREYYSYNNDKFAWLKRPLRIRRMLGRYHTDKKLGLYDVAIVGHTHQAGRFCRWYYNSGSWTGRTNNFMRIEPDGTVQLFDWSRDGAARNETVIDNQ